MCEEEMGYFEKNFIDRLSFLDFKSLSERMVRNFPINNVLQQVKTKKVNNLESVDRILSVLQCK